MPPEQAKGQIDQIDHRTDIYSLGAVLFELLTGTTPFDCDDASLREIIRQVIEDQPRSITALESKAPPELAAIAVRALQKDRKNRYQSARDLAAEIQRFQSGALVNAYSYGLPEYLGRYIKRHKTIVATTAAAAALIIALTAAYTIQISRTNEALRLSRDEEVRQRHESENQTKLAETREAEARGARDNAEKQLYLSTMFFVPQYIGHGSGDSAFRSLWQAPERYRSWEWGICVGARRR